MSTMNKNTAFLIFFFLQLSLFATSPATVLDKKINLEAKNETLGNILKRIEKIAGVNFIYVSGIINDKKIINCSFSNIKLGIILQYLINADDVLLYVIDNKIILYKKGDSPPGSSGSIYNAKPEDIVINKSSGKSRNKSNNYPDTSFITIYDSVKIQLYDTIKIFAYDTLRVIKYDTVPFRWFKTINKNPPKGFFIGGNACIRINNDKLEYKENTNLKEYHESSEGNTENTFGGGVGLGYSFGNLSVQTGLDYYANKWNANYDYQTTTIDSSVIVDYEDVFVWILGPGPGPIALRDSIRILVDRKPIYKTNTYYNSYTGQMKLAYVSIPLLLTYSISLKKRIQIALTTGLVCNILVDTEGKTIANDYSLVSLNEIYSDVYLSSLSNISVAYKLTDHHQVSLYGGYKFNMTSITDQSHFFKKKERNISLGLAYSFFFNSGSKLIKR